MRRSLLFIPGNRPSMIQYGDVLPADALIFDLEDSVTPEEKDAARDLVASALRSIDFGRRERLVRINDLNTMSAQSDLDAMVAAGVDAIMVPKVAGAETIKAAASMLSEAERAHGRVEGRTALVALLESAQGIEHAFEIALASPRVSGLALGGEDLSADLGCPRTREGWEIFYSRSRLVMAAKAADIDALDTPFTDIHDVEGCQKDASFARSLGFTGKLSISPLHLKAIHRAFTPSEEEIDYAKEIIRAMEEGQKTGKSAVPLRGKMIDPPVLRQAERVLALAKAAGLPEGEGEDHDPR